MIRFDVVTLFPEMFAAVTASGITRKALEAGLWRLQTWNPRDFTTDNYRTVDDRPYGGGPGMVMLAEPLEKALDAAQAAGGGKVIFLSPQGRKLDHGKVMELSGRQAVTLLCGRYEGVDERLVRRRVDEELSLGDFVLSGGELAAMAVIDAVVRQIPGALGGEQRIVIGADFNQFQQLPFQVLRWKLRSGFLDVPHQCRRTFHHFGLGNARGRAAGRGRWGG